MSRPVIYASSLTRRQARWRRARRRGALFGPRLATLVLWLSATAFAVVVIQHVL